MDNLWLYLEILGTVVGLFYLWFEYRASIWLWATSIIMPAIYIFVYGHGGFYADMGINIYYLFAGVYGWIVWMRNGGADTWRKTVTGTWRKKGTGTPRYKGAEVPAIESGTDEATASGSGEDKRRCENNGSGKNKDGGGKASMPITRTPKRYWPKLLGVAALVFAAIAALLVNFTDSTVPYGDSFTTALSIVGMWMLARKYLEQWLVWIAVDVVCTGLYIYKGLYPTAGLYALYSIIAVFGYFNWKRMMNRQTA